MTIDDCKLYFNCKHDYELEKIFGVKKSRISQFRKNGIDHNLQAKIQIMTNNKLKATPAINPIRF